MSKEKFDWKGLFINEDVPDKSKPKKEESRPTQSSKSSSFPEIGGSNTKFPENLAKSNALSEDVLNTIIEMYESGFESLNKPGYDFYEFFKAIKAVGSNDPQVYKMALTMAQSADQNVSKTSLLNEADYYIAEIEKVYNKYKTQGASKKAGIQESQRIKKENLTTEISGLEKKLMEIQNQISQKRNDLQSVDINLMTEVAEIDQKIAANDVAKSKILETITVVVEGIKNNV